jgi:hypothetical protein
MHPITLALAVGSVFLNAMAQIALRKTMLTAGPLPSGVANARLRVFAALKSLVLSWHDLLCPQYRDLADCSWKDGG